MSESGLKLKMASGREIRIPLGRTTDALDLYLHVLQNPQCPRARVIRRAARITGDRTGLIKLAASMLKETKDKSK